MTALEARRTSARKLVPTLCYNCVAGPDFMQVIVEDGVATGIEPNHRAVGVQQTGDNLLGLPPCRPATGTPSPGRTRRSWGWSGVTDFLETANDSFH